MTGSESTARKLRRLGEPLRVLMDGGPPILESWLPDLKDALKLDLALSYGVRAEGPGFALESVVLAGFSLGRPGVVSEMEGLFRRRTRWGLFDPARPEPQQRNRPFATGPFRQNWEQLCARPRLFKSRYGMDERAQSELARSIENVAATFDRIGTGRHHRLRMLVCEGDSLLSFVGAYRDRPFDATELRLMTSLAPGLSRRLSLERLLGTAELTRAALSAALEQISRPAYVLAQQGTVAAANSLGRAALDREPTAVRQRLTEALRNGDADPAFRVAFLEGRGLPPHALAIEQGAPDASAVTLAAARRWGLTPREREVLTQIAMGRANKAISATLGCSDKTVELHVTRLLRKAEVDSRSALIAKLWSQRG